MAQASTRRASALLDVIGRVREVVASQLPHSVTAVTVAGCLRPTLQRSDLLTDEQQEGWPAEYRQHVLHVEPDGSFSVVALVWLPGQSTPIHDHVSWCSVGVYRGEETEHRYRVAEGAGGPRLALTGRAVNRSGSVCGIAPPGDIHYVTNSGTTKAISLHVYGADIARLGSSIRRRYDLPVG